MSNLLLITDVSRLQNIFGLLSVNPAVRLRIATNLEKGSEEIMNDRPDIVFIQTHISGFSADILLKHLKNHARDTLPYFVLLAAPSQLGTTTLQSFQGWLDTTADDGRFLVDLQSLVSSLVATSVVTESPDVFDTKPATHDAATPGDSLEDQGLLYTPRPRFSVYSEFTASFDSAVRETGEPEQLPEQVQADMATEENTEPADHYFPVTKRSRAKRTSFLLWLVVVVIAGVAFTFYQQSRPDPKNRNEQALAPGKPKEAERIQPVSSSARITAALLKPISSNVKGGTNSTAKGPVQLPTFIPRAALDTSYATANPGWERYTTKDVEFRVYRMADAIKAIQIIALAGSTFSDTFLQDIQRQLTSNPTFVRISSEKTEGYTIERGKLSDTIKAVYYRDGNGKNLKAVVLTWP